MNPNIVTLAVTFAAAINIPTSSHSETIWSVTTSPAEITLRCEAIRTIEDVHTLDTLIGISGTLQREVADVIQIMLETGYSSRGSGKNLYAAIQYKLVFEQEISLRGKMNENGEQILLGFFRQETRWRAEIDSQYRELVTPETKRTVAFEIEDWAEKNKEEIASLRSQLHESTFNLSNSDIRSAYELRKPSGLVQEQFTIEFCEESADGVLSANWIQGEFQ